MKKVLAIGLALGAVVGFVAYRAIKNLKEEMETIMPMDPDDFGDPVVQDPNGCECECTCGGECTCANGTPAHEENTP